MRGEDCRDKTELDRSLAVASEGGTLLSDLCKRALSLPVPSWKSIREMPGVLFSLGYFLVFGEEVPLLASFIPDRAGTGRSCNVPRHGRG